MTWHSLIDWVSFTVRVGDDGKHVQSAIERLPYHLIDEYASPLIVEAVTGGDTGWEFRSGRRPYKGGWCHPETGRYVWAGGHPHVLIEFSGQGCKYLADNGLLKTVLQRCAKDATRLDVACDLVTDLSPIAFANAGYSANVKTRNERVSESGTTVTLGSWKSDRFVNVYRYNPPHPRADRLRVEFRLKRDYAKSAAAFAAYYDAAHVAGMLHNSYRFRHESWESKKVSERLKGAEQHQNKASTLRWVLKQVAPAIQKLIREGVIDEPHKFFEEHFMPESKQLGMFDND